MFRRLFLTVVLTALPLAGMQAAEERAIESLLELEEALCEADESTLLVFDIDNTLTISTHPAFQIPNWANCKSIIKQHYLTLSPDEREAAVNLIVTQHPLDLIEGRAPAWIAEQQARGVSVLALTAAWSGGDLGQLRCATLEKLGFEFGHSWPRLERQLFEQYCRHAGGHPLYDRGVLFANGFQVEKGELLLRFFGVSGYWPKRVIFVDDQKDHLVELGSALESAGIEVVLCHYLGALQYPAGCMDEAEIEEAWRGVAVRAREIASREESK